MKIVIILKPILESVFSHLSCGESGILQHPRWETRILPLYVSQTKSMWLAILLTKYTPMGIEPMTSDIANEYGDQCVIRISSH